MFLSALALLRRLCVFMPFLQIPCISFVISISEGRRLCKKSPGKTPQWLYPNFLLFLVYNLICDGGERQRWVGGVNAVAIQLYKMTLYPFTSLKLSTPSILTPPSAGNFIHSEKKSTNFPTIESPSFPTSVSHCL